MLSERASDISCSPPRRWPAADERGEKHLCPLRSPGRSFHPHQRRASFPLLPLPQGPFRFKGQGEVVYRQRHLPAEQDSGLGPEALPLLSAEDEVGVAQWTLGPLA